MGPAATPPSAASATPKPNMPLNSAGILPPRPAAIGGIVDAGAHHGADAAALEKQPEQQRDGKAEADQEQAIRREHPGADLHGSLQRLRHRKPQHGSAPDRLHQIQEHEGEAEGQQHLIHVAAAIERPHEQPLDHDPESRSPGWAPGASASQKLPVARKIDSPTIGARA